MKAICMDGAGRQKGWVGGRVFGRRKGLGEKGAGVGGGRGRLPGLAEGAEGAARVRGVGGAGPWRWRPQILDPAPAEKPKPPDPPPSQSSGAKKPTTFTTSGG